MKGRRKIGLGDGGRKRRGGAGGLIRRKVTKFSLYITFLISCFFIFLRNYYYQLFFLSSSPILFPLLFINYCSFIHHQLLYKIHSLSLRTFLCLRPVEANLVNMKSQEPLGGFLSYLAQGCTMDE